MYKLNNDEYETLKFPLNILFLCSEFRVALGTFEKPFLAFTQGELEPQFASKDSYLDQNIKQVAEVVGGS